MLLFARNCNKLSITTQWAFETPFIYEENPAKDIISILVGKDWLYYNSICFAFFL